MTFDLWVACSLIGSPLCAWRAHRQGYSRLLFGAIALLLGPGALLLTWLLTREPARIVPASGTGFCPEEAPTVLEVDCEALEDLRIWTEFYQSLRLGLYLTTMLLSLGVVMALYWLIGWIVPTFVALYEGMSLALPWPTQVLIAITRFGRRGALAWPLLALTPATLYLVLARLGYGTPFLGRVWRQVDQLWLLQARRAGGAHWCQFLPPSVLARHPVDEPPQDYDRAYRRAHLQMVASLWSLLPCALAVLLILAVVAGLVGMAIFLPLHCGLIGNIGG